MDDKLAELKNLIENWLDDPQWGADCLLPLLWEAVGQATEEKEAALPPLTRITAEQVQLLVTDQETGRPFLRSLPLDYLETSNGITLAGESYAAQPTQIVFFTEFALGKLLELQGEEGDCDHDHDHDHDSHEHHHD